MCVCVCVCVRARARACVRACVRVCVRMRACIHYVDSKRVQRDGEKLERLGETEREGGIAVADAESWRDQAYTLEMGTSVCARQ